MSLEVVAEFASREYHCVKQLLDLWVARLGFGQDFTDVVHRPLDGQRVPLLRALYYDDGADHLGSCDHVEVQRFAILRWCEDWGMGKGRLQLIERLLGLDGLGEPLMLLEEPVEGQALLAEPRDEAAQGGKAPQHLLDPLEVPNQAHSFEGCNLFGVGC
jgi:hypothetical protein